MSHKSIRLLIEETANGLADDVQYSYATETDFNQSRKKGTILINTSPLVSIPTYQQNGTNYMKQWNVDMVFYKPDHSSSTTEYINILDELDTLVDRFINDLNFFQAKSDQITLSAFNQTPFIKAQTADILTGWLLTFQILAMDDFDYCRDC